MVLDRAQLRSCGGVARHTSKEEEVPHVCACGVVRFSSCRNHDVRRDDRADENFVLGWVTTKTH